jgi:hypothetical protein
MAASFSADFGIAAGESEQAIARPIDPASNNAGMSQRRTCDVTACSTPGRRCQTFRAR